MIVRVMDETLTATRDINQCPGSLLKKTSAAGLNFDTNSFSLKRAYRGIKCSVSIVETVYFSK